MHHFSKPSVVLLPPGLVPLAVLAAGVLIGRAERWKPSLDAAVSVAAWALLCVALVWLLLRTVAWLAHDLPAADDDDAYYRRKRGERT